MKILTSEQMQSVEKYAADRGLDYARMMENAGSACAKIIKEKALLKFESLSSVCVVCGKGKNAGDGFVIARKLSEFGCRVHVVLVMGLPTAEDSIEMFNRLINLQVNIIEYRTDNEYAEKVIKTSQVVVDAIFGFGFHGRISVELEILLNLMSQAKGLKAAVDIPTGVICDTGEVTSAYFKADLTIAISALKKAHVVPPSSFLCGDVEIAEIGIDEECYDVLGKGGIYTLKEEDVKKKFVQRTQNSNKGDFGHLLSICGSKNYQGAAVLAAMGAINSGVGLVTAAFPDCAYSAIGAKLTEPILLPLNSNQEGMLSISALQKLRQSIQKADTILMGCGIGVCADTKELVNSVLEFSKCPIILDADGINVLSGNIDILKAIKIPLILTPHPGEMSRLTGHSIADIQANRELSAKEFADNYGVTLVLKGANTVVASPDSDSIYVNTTGNSGMACGGSGDLLAGIMASFVAQGMSCNDAAISAVYIHGAVGDAAAKKTSQRGLTPTACAKELPLLLSKFE